jgi:hypothetical protein
MGRAPRPLQVLAGEARKEPTSHPGPGCGRSWSAGWFLFVKLPAVAAQLVAVAV